MRHHPRPNWLLVYLLRRLLCKEECILGNILDRDEIAIQVLEKQAAQMPLDDDLLRECYSQTAINYPWWWVSPHEEMGGSSLAPYTSLSSNTDMVRACDDMKALLNKDSFEDEINHFARRLMATHGHGSHEAVQARVTAVGRRGFCMRVLVADEIYS